MQLKKQMPVLECTLLELWDQGLSKVADGNDEALREIEVALRGESKIKPRFRIPSADGESDVFFDNREMFCRFASLPTPTQRELLRAMRQVLQENSAEQMEMLIPWSKSGQKKLRVRVYGKMGDRQVLDFEMHL